MAKDTPQSRTGKERQQYVFDRLLLNAVRSGQVPERTAEARKWMMQKARRVSDSRERFFSGAGKARRKSKVTIGKMYFFKYDAKTKEELPYWDAVPVIFPFAEEGKYFYGVNLHYTPLAARVKILDALHNIRTDNNFDQNTRIALSYGVLKESSKFKPLKFCIKKYLKSRVKSQFIEVDSMEWSIAAFLPLAQWRKGSPQRVYADYRKFMAKN